jgi:tetratricopeptide (TPR) repeat protein
VTRSLLIFLACLLAGCGDAGEPPPEPVSAPAAAAVAAAEPGFVGGAVCAECHAAETKRWRGSHHDLAMQEADAAMAPFAGERFDGRGPAATFTRRDGRPWVEAPGPDGEPADFPVNWVFGVDPLQQVLLGLDGGRYQAFTVAWDARSEEAGGQRWYSLYPDETIPPGDALHWTARAHNWNASCGVCHSTNYERRWLDDEQRYATTFSEIDVSCEACHGPGSEHVRRARDGDTAPGGLANDLRSRGHWTRAADAPIARRESPPPSLRREVEACAPCHSRRSPLVPGSRHGARFLDAYRPALLDEPLYFADGQILDEVYVWGSFVQSAMYAAGVTCSDCHDPHALRIEDADATCARCHSPAVFAAPAHHHHQPGSDAARCVSCHMPERVYMGVDARHDHSLRVPRPDVSAQIGSPDACTACHADRDPAWAARAIADWGGSRAARPHFGPILQAGREGRPGAASALLDLAADSQQPGIVRASALRLLGSLGGPAGVHGVAAGARDAEPLLRLAAAGASANLPPAERLAAARPLLDDPRAAVRMEAARNLVGVPPPSWKPGDRTALTAPLAEWRDAQRGLSDDPVARVNLASLYAELGEPEATRRELEASLRLNPSLEPAWVNLADLERALGRDAEAEQVLRRGLAQLPEGAALHYSLGLALVRLGRLDEALPQLARAVELAPRVARYAYVLGVALSEAGRPEEGLEVLEAASQRRPGDRDLLQALVAFHGQAGNADRAAEYSGRLQALDAPARP